MEEKKEILKIFSGEQSLIPSTQKQSQINIMENFLELLVNALPRMAEAFRDPQIKEVVTLRVFADEYLYLIKNNRSTSYSESVQLSFNHLTSFFDSQKSISSIQLKDIENFLAYLQQKVVKGYVVYCKNLKAAFNKARDWGYVSENYFTKVKLPKRQKLAPVFINSNQLSAICNQIKNEVVKDVVVFAFYTGMRLDEIVNLRWKNVDLQNGVITVGDEEYTTKGRNQRFIPMSEEAFEILVRRERAKVKGTPSRLADGQTCVLSIKTVDPSTGSTASSSGSELRFTTGSLWVANGFVFCKSNGVRYSDDHYSKVFKKACKAAGMDNAIHFHTLRHSFASNLAQKGVSLYTIKELLGHSSISTTEIYSHLNMDSLREAVKMLDTSASLSAGVKGETEEGRPPLSFGHLPPSLCSGQALENKGEKYSVKIFRINSGEK